MTTGTPVVVSRIQNRRGTQAQFDNLYPTYPGTGPNILQPGELALCTDTRRIFIGNLNGEYVEITGSSSNEICFSPIVISLWPSANYVEIPELTYDAMPFLSLVYGLTDAQGLAPSIPASPYAVGTTISKNGKLEITATDTQTMLTDSATEINNTDYDISFKTEYVGNKIRIFYSHNFPTTLTFSTRSIVWTCIDNPVAPPAPPVIRVPGAPTNVVASVIPAPPAPPVIRVPGAPTNVVASVIPAPPAPPVIRVPGAPTNVVASVIPAPPVITVPNAPTNVVASVI